MKKLVVASIAAFASLFVSAHIAASAINARDARMQHEGWGGLTMHEGWNEPKMAQAVTPDLWFIKGVITLAAGGERVTQFMVPDEDRGGQPAVLTFDSEAACEEARTKDPDIIAPLALFVQIVKSRGDSVVVLCAKWQHPVVKPPGQEI